MEAAINGENGRRRVVAAKGSDAEKHREDDHHHDDEVNLKKMIASHPLYGLLIESHFDCLKVGVGLDEIAECDRTKDAGKQIAATTPPSSSELDHFMEAYCVALRKLKEAIEEPTRETKAFINATYMGLKDLISDDNIESSYDPRDPSHSHLDQQSST